MTRDKSEERAEVKKGWVIRVLRGLKRCLADAKEGRNGSGKRAIMNCRCILPIISSEVCAERKTTKITFTDVFISLFISV